MKRLALLLLLTGCPKPEPAPPPSLLAEARSALAERERRLTSFRVQVDSTQGESRARHEFLYRSPNKSRGHLLAPQDVELAFDGATFVRINHHEKKYEVVKLEMPEADRAFFLASAFTAFVPEGFRAPLLPMKGVTAARVVHAKAPEAVALTVQPGEGVTVTYVLRLPAGDFLEKRTVAEGKTRVLAVLEEKCDAALTLCVPVKLAEAVDGATLGTTTLTQVELNPALPQDAFSPKPAAGYAVTN